MPFCSKKFATTILPTYSGWLRLGEWGGNTFCARKYEAMIIQTTIMPMLNAEIKPFTKLKISHRDVWHGLMLSALFSVG